MTSKPLPILSYNDNLFRSDLIIPDNKSVYSKIDYVELEIIARNFCSSAFDNLDEFSYLYFTAGVTESIDFLLSRGKFNIFPGEYRYARIHNTICDTPVENFYLSYPFSGNGKFLDIPTNRNVILDCSYIFASDMKCNKILPNNVDYVLFGVSKSHNLSDLRVGWFFSKKKIHSYHILQREYGYGGIMHKLVLENISKKRPNELYIRYRDEISNNYKKHNLVEGNTNLFALSETERIPYYKVM
jgi:hypothetical protein